jgi:DNA replication protein DnaC
MHRQDNPGLCTTHGNRSSEAVTASRVKHSRPALSRSELTLKVSSCIKRAGDHRVTWIDGKRRWQFARKRIQMSSSIAKLPFVRTLDGFEFAAQPSLDSKLVRELATCRWVGNGDALLLLGPPGVGKTHLAVALGREAIQHGYSTLFTSATALVTALTKAHHAGRLEERLTHYAKPKLLIVDELGYLPLEANAAHLFFQLVSRRYERGSILVTSNRAVSEWGTVFGDSVVATAILDRLLHHSHVITIRGDSYRLREKRRSGLVPQRSTDKELEKLT